MATRTKFRDASSYYPGGFGFGTYSGTLPNLTGDYTVQKGIYTAKEFMGMSAKNGTRTYSSAHSSDDAYHIWDLMDSQQNRVIKERCKPLVKYWYFNNPNYAFKPRYW